MSSTLVQILPPQIPEAFLLPWVESLAQMPDDECDTLQAARYARVGRRAAQVETDGEPLSFSME
jgi:hypothetical protein